MASNIKVLAAPVNFDKYVAQFMYRFPGLQKMNSSYGRCKLVSYELAKFLREHGVKAFIYHLEGVKKGSYPNPHKDYQEKKPSEWSHYIVKVRNQGIDLTARQFDKAAPLPLVAHINEFKAKWEKCSRDDFMNKFLEDALRARI